MKKVFSQMLLLATLLTFTACGGDDEPSPASISEYNYSIYAGATTEVKGQSLKNLKWTGDNFVAEVDDQGVLHGKKIGYTVIRATGITSGNYSTIRVDVKPRNTTFSEPLLYYNIDQYDIKYRDGYLSFGQTTSAYVPKSDIWGMHSSFLTSHIQRAGLPWTLYRKTSGYMMFKTDKVASPYVAYLLDNNGYITGAGVYADPFKCGTLPDFLNERYLIYDVNMSSYTANFVHKTGGSIDYAGQMAYSNSLGLIILAYIKNDSKSRAEELSAIQQLQKIEL